MTGRLPKGSWPAVTDIERIGFSRLRLYEHYDRDDGIREALIQLHGEWWSRLGRSLRRLDDCLPDLDDAERHLADLVGLEPAHDYFGGLGALAAKAGLDRIPMVGTPPLVIAGYLPSGTAQAHRFLWGLDKALNWRRRRREPAKESFRQSGARRSWLLPASGRRSLLWTRRSPERRLGGTRVRSSVPTLGAGFPRDGPGSRDDRGRARQDRLTRADISSLTRPRSGAESGASIEMPSGSGGGSDDVGRMNRSSESGSVCTQVTSGFSTGSTTGEARQSGRAENPL